MYEDFFKRQIELWGEEKQSSLETKTILIVGCGGLGSNLTLTLGASGIGYIILVDFDRVEIHNIHRQIAFSTEDTGRFKAETLKEKIKKRYADVEVTVITDTFENTVDTLKTKKIDLILDATDNFQTRAAIDAFSSASGTPWIYTSVEEFMAQICFFKNASFKSFASKQHTPRGIAAPIVSLAASIEANIAIRYLVGLPVPYDTLHYFYIDQNGSLELKKFTL